MIWIEIVKDMSADNMTETIALNDKNRKSDHDNDGNRAELQQRFFEDIGRAL